LLEVRRDVGSYGVCEDAMEMEIFVLVDVRRWILSWIAGYLGRGDCCWESGDVLVEVHRGFRLRTR